jgi:ornithine carbamoyltransferase
MIFQKPSTRTAVSFAVAMYEMGGLALTLSEQQLQLKRGETWRTRPAPCPVIWRAS